MPRRRPGELRVRPVRRSDVRKERGLPRGSARLMKAVAGLERDGLGSIARALWSWALEGKGRLVRYPCCCDEDPCQARWVLENAMRTLPRMLARELRELVDPLDDRYRAVTVPDPFAAPDAPWWARRMRS